MNPKSLLPAVLLTLILALGCNKSQTTTMEGPVGIKPPAITVDASTAGSITGVVTYVGMPQKMGTPT